MIGNKGRAAVSAHKDAQYRGPGTVQCRKALESSIYLSPGLPPKPHTDYSLKDANLDR